MHKASVSVTQIFKWLISRVAVIYAVVFIFSLTCVDLKNLEMRVKVRRLNQAVPNFTQMVNFSLGKNGQQVMNWAPYKNYFELILRYLPGDAITEQLLGYVDFYRGQEEKAISLFKDSAAMKGHSLFWSNYNLGVIYYKKGMWPQAAEYLFKAISANTRLTGLLMQESIIYKQIFFNLPFSYNMSDGINSAKSKAYILLLSSLHYMGQYDKMMAISKLALEDPDLFYKDAFYYYAGLGFYERGQDKEAFLLLQKSLMVEKNNPEVYYYIASIYHRGGQEEYAQEFLQASYALHKKNDPRFPYEAHIDLGFF